MQTWTPQQQTLKKTYHLSATVPLNASEICVFTLSLGLLSPPNPPLLARKRFDRNYSSCTGRSSENICSNSGGDQEKNERQGETRKTIKMLMYRFFADFSFGISPCLRPLALSFPDFTDNSNEKAQRALRPQIFHICTKQKKKIQIFLIIFQKRSTFWGLLWWYLKKSSKAPPLDDFFSVI
jgi:hypothetical protein